jgi:putrescine aminotransferase
MVPNPVIHSTTFGGSPLACAAGLAAMQVTLEEDLPGQAAAKGASLLGRLTELRDRYPGVIADVRGKGLLLGMEFREPEVGWKVAAGLFRRGVLVAGTCSNARVIRLEPALGIPQPLLEEAVNRIADALGEVSGRATRAAAMSAPTRRVSPTRAVRALRWTHERPTVQRPRSARSAD